MNIYFDFKFTGLNQNTTPISMALLTDTNERFYAEFVDYDKSMLDDWTKENIISNLWSVSKNISEITSNKNFIIGTRKSIAEELKDWLKQFGDKEITLVGDCCHYDMCLFLELFGGATEAPKNIAPVACDINSHIASMESISQSEAFDMDRLTLIANASGNDKLKRNSYSYVEIIRALYYIYNTCN